MLKKFLYIFFFISILFTIYANIINFTNDISKNTNLDFGITEQISYFVSTNSENLFWPTPGYNKITSPFGSRISPITKKSSFHSGIDIGANEGSLIYSASDGIVSFLGFNGANGYSIHILANNFIFIYGHVSPNFIIKNGDFISKRSNYTEMLDQNMFLKLKTILIQILLGKSTNGSTTGPHLHFTIKKDGKAVNPLNYF